MPGWDEIARAHELQVDDLLLFKCTGNGLPKKKIISALACCSLKRRRTTYFLPDQISETETETALGLLKFLKLKQLRTLLKFLKLKHHVQVVVL